MKLCSNFTIILLLSPCFVFSDPGRADEIDGHLQNGNQTEVGDIGDGRQGGVGPEAAKETSSRALLPDGKTSEDPEKEDEGTKTIELPIEAEPHHTEGDVARGSPQQAVEQDSSKGEKAPRTHQAESNHNTENSEGDESSKDESEVRLSDAEPERLDGASSRDAAPPDTRLVDRTEPSDEAADERIDDRDLGRGLTRESGDAVASNDETEATTTAEGKGSIAMDDRDLSESKAPESEKVDVDLDCMHDASAGGATQPPVEPQTRLNPNDNEETEAVASLETSATGVDEPPPLEAQAQGIENTANIVSDAEGDTSPEPPTIRLSEKGFIDETHPLPVCGVWGKMQAQRRADLKVLYLLFENIELGGPRRKEIPNPEDWANQITEDGLKESRRARRNTSDVSSPSKTHEQDDGSSNETRTAKSANSEFVDGLDDIGKFFEDVEPPDELDVGAVGSSIQEVLMGQGTRIVLKRLQMGLQFVRTTLLTAKEMFAQRFIDEDGNLTIVDQERLEAVAAWVWKSSKRLYHEAQTFLDKLVERGIAGGLSREYEEDEASPLPSPDNNDDVRELLRQYSRVGGGSTPKKYA